MRSPWSSPDADPRQLEPPRVMRFATTTVAEDIAWRRSVPVGMNTQHLEYLRESIWTSWRHYPLSTAGAASSSRSRASSSGELGAIGLARTGTGSRSPFAQAARSDRRSGQQSPGAPVLDPVLEEQASFVVPQSSTSRLQSGSAVSCVVCGQVFDAT